ncbi:MAG: M14 family zinc carboxypeptidase [Bacteroidales bacterium]|nr:M14 family zinc carboxypeptidase [Bacteroidales bacterium]
MKTHLKQIIHSPMVMALIIMLFSSGFSPVSAVSQTRDYSPPDEVNKRILQIKQDGGEAVKIHKIAVSPGGTDLLMLEIGTETGSGSRENPAILVAGNMDGTRPITTEAALFLAERVLSDRSNYADLTWYILPMGNPDAHSGFFENIIYVDSRNLSPYNDDMDELTDEDPFNDLDGNGIITKMRVRAPGGTWLPVSGEPRLMRQAEYKDGEKGIYKIYDEGIDDDGDGEYNEDGKGGTNINANFPHLFEPLKLQSGLYPGSTTEVYAILKFAFEHPEIALSFSFGSTNFLLSPPRGGRKGSVDMDKISIPEQLAEMMGFDHTRTYTMQEIMEKVQPMLPAGMEVDESMIASFLGLGAVVNPMQEDLVFYNSISEEYKKYLEEKAGKSDRIDPAPAKDGSFELWSYYHLGVPVFSMDLWGVPKKQEEKKASSGITVESLEKMSSDEFIALGEEKISQFLKESGAPAEFSAERVLAMVKGGQVSPAQMAGMMKQMPKPAGDTKKGDPDEQALLAFSDEVLEGAGFVDWKPYSHPDLGEVEIGGFTPYSDINPPAEMLDSLLGLHVPFLFELVKKLPKLAIAEVKVEDRGAGIYAVDIWIENKGFLPFVTQMGKRNKVPSPAIINITGNDLQFLSGKKRTPVNELDGKKAVKYSWLIRSDKDVTVMVELDSKTAGHDTKQIKLGE